MSNERETIIKRVKKLLNMTEQNGASESEALFAASKASDLMTEYLINVNELNIKSNKAGIAVFETRFYGKHGIAENVAVVVAKLCEGFVWRSADRKSIQFFGMPDDTDIALYLMETITNAIIWETAKYKQGQEYFHLTNLAGYHGKAVLQSFIHGMESRLCARIKELDAMKNVKVKACGNALIVVKQALVQTEYEQMKIKTRKNYGQRRVSAGNAFDAGKNAGDRVTLNNTISESKKLTG